MKTDRKPKFNIKDWFFSGAANPQPATVRTRLRKLIDIFPVTAGEYLRKPAGNLQLVRPRKFRRGLIHWTKGGKQVGQFRWKFWTLKGR